MISQLMTQLNKLMKLEKYQQGKVMIIQLVAYRLFAADLSKQKALDADLRTIQQVIFTGKIKSAVANAKVIIYYILEKSKGTMLQFSKGTTKVLSLV